MHCSYCAHHAFRKLSRRWFIFERSILAFQFPNRLGSICRLMSASWKCALCFLPFILLGAKAQMQTIIINDFPRSLYKHFFFRFLLPSSLLLWQQLTMSVALLCFIIVSPHCRELWFPPVKEAPSEGARRQPLWRTAGHSECETKTDCDLLRDSGSTRASVLAARGMTLVTSIFFSSNNRVSVYPSVSQKTKKTKHVTL